MKKTQNTILKTVNDFEREVHLYRLVTGGTGKALVLLRKLADKIHQDNYSSPGAKLPSLLLCGKEATRLHALALLNSLCIEDVRECDARYLDAGLNSKELFENSYFDTCHLITNVEQLRPQQEAILWRFLRMGWCSYHNYAKQAKELIHSNGMIILTTKDFSRVPSSLTSAVDYKIGIEEYNQTNLQMLIHQQLQYCGIDYGDEEGIITFMIEFGCGQLELIFDLLKICILLAQTDHQNKLTLKTVKQAAKLV